MLETLPNSVSPWITINEYLTHCRLFEEHAELLNLFEKFQELKTRQQQEESMELAEHATMVMSTLDQVIPTTTFIV